MAECEQLILFSDMEGCLALNNNIRQHTLLCDSATFKAIYAFLETSTNHVAFCGDYFDAGPKIAESIIGMAWLKESFPNQVHIILGNRDINKMRLKYEKILVGNASLDEIVKMSETAIYDTWENFWIKPLTAEALKATKGESFVPYPDDPIDRVTNLLAKTFGASNLLSNLVSELKITTNAEALALFDTIFTGLTNGRVIPTGMSPNTQPVINVATFVTACKNIFFHGKLIEIITVGIKKVLLSHAGSSHIAIYTADYSNAIAEVMALSAFRQLVLGDYFVALETYRANLECTDAGTTTNGKITYNVYSLLPIKTVIENINNLKDQAYRDILSVVQVTGPSVQVSQAWLLVQAMGIGGKKVATPIQSCILTPMCRTPIEELSPKITAYFSSSESKVDIIAHGHIPSCVTVPIIARFTSAIIFVALDQSNGNRPSVQGITLKNVPIACISKETIGIVSLNDEGTLNDAETRSSEGYLIYAYQNGFIDNDPNYYRDLVKTHNYDNSIPMISTINTYINSSSPNKFPPMLRYDTNYKDMIRANEVRRDSDTQVNITSGIIRERDDHPKDSDEGGKDEKGEKTWKKPSGAAMVDGGNKNKSKNKRLRKCRKCLMCCNGSCDYSAKLNNTKRGSKKRKKARKTIKKSNNSKQRTRKQKKARKHKK